MNRSIYWSLEGLIDDWKIAAKDQTNFSTDRNHISDKKNDWFRLRHWSETSGQTESKFRIASFFNFFSKVFELLTAAGPRSLPEEQPTMSDSDLALSPTQLGSITHSRMQEWQIISQFRDRCSSSSGKIWRWFLAKFTGTLDPLPVVTVPQFRYVRYFPVNLNLTKISEL